MLRFWGGCNEEMGFIGERRAESGEGEERPVMATTGATTGQ